MVNPILDLMKGKTSQETSQVPNDNPILSIMKDQGTPENVKLAQSQTGSQKDNGYCERFVEKVTYGKTGMFGSAAQAWDKYNQQGKAVQGLAGLKPGDSIYFTPDNSNDGDGHTGIYMGDNKFISATNQGVKEEDFSNWYKMTGQKILGYIPHPGGSQ